MEESILSNANEFKGRFSYIETTKEPIAFSVISENSSRAILDVEEDKEQEEGSGCDV